MYSIIESMNYLDVVRIFQWMIAESFVAMKQATSTFWLVLRIRPVAAAVDQLCK